MTLQDNGGTAGGGVDTSAPQTFTITVNPVNGAPSFTKGADQIVAEDSGTQTVNPWATAISAGPPDEADQVLTFNITGNTNPTLFSAAPVVSPAGVLTYTPAANASGTATITLTLSDDGGTAGGGVDTSGPQTFTITVTEVNDAPSFVAGAGPTSAEDAGAQSVNPWATAISPGPPGEAAQTVTFIVTGNTNPALFSAGPAVSPTGILTYTSAPNAFGTATITLVLQDNGGTAGGGVNASPPQMFSITVTPVNDAPAVAGETFQLLGNTELRVDLAAGTTPHALETTAGASPVKGVLDNDSDPEGDPFTVTAITGCADASAPFDCTLPGGAVVHVEADGAFSVIPAPAATTAGFTYTATDTPAVGTAASTTGAVTFTVFDMIWYVDGNAAGPGNGTSADPFDSFTATNLNGAGGAGDLDDADDYIFVYDSTITGGIALEAGQHLLAEFVGLSIDRDLNGNGAPTLLVAAGGARTAVSSSTGSAIAMTNAVPAEIRGFTLTSTAGDAINLTTSGALSGASTLTITNNEISAASAEGVDVAIGAGTTGALTVQIQGNTWNAANVHAGNAIDVTNASAAGNLVLDVSGNANVKSNANGIFVDGGGIARTRVAGFAGNSVHAATLGAGVTVQNVTFDASAGGSIDPVNGGNSTIGADGDGVGGTALSITGSQGSLLFGNLLAYGANGLNLAGTAGLSVGVTPFSSGGASEIKSTAGLAVQANSVALDLQLAELVSSGAAAGVALTTTSGTFSAPTGSSITKASGGGTAFSVSSSSTTVSYGGTLNVTSGSGVALAGNTGAMSFTGQLTLNTGTAAAFAASGGGTVTATNTANTLATTTATALNVSGPDIGAGGLVFRSIASNGAASGIVLANTGTTAGLTVSGTGGAGTGGLINNSTGHGISLTDAGPVTLSLMNIQNGADDGIHGATVRGLTLNGVNVANNGNAVGDDGIEILQLTGSGGMTNVTVSGSAENNVRIANNTAGTLTAFNVTGSTFATTDFITGNDGFLVEQNGTGAMTVNITGNTFTDNKGDHFQVASQASASGSINLTFSNNTLTTTPANDPNVIGGGITISPSGSTDVTFTVSDNVINQAFDDAININSGTASTAAAALIGTISGNTIGTAGEVDSGSESSNTITVSSVGAGTTTVLVTGNTLFQYGNGSGISLEAREGSATLNATVTNNTASNDGTFAINGIRLSAGATSGPPADNSFVCAAISGNNVTGAGKNSSAGEDDIRVRQTFATTIRLPGYAGANNDNAAVNAFLAAANDPAGATPAPSVSSVVNVPGGGGFVGGAACPTPP